MTTSKAQKPSVTTSETQRPSITTSETQGPSVTTKPICIVINCDLLWVKRGTTDYPHIKYKKNIHTFLKDCLSHGKLAFYANYDRDNVHFVSENIVSKMYTEEDVLFFKYKDKVGIADMRDYYVNARTKDGKRLLMITEKESRFEEDVGSYELDPVEEFKEIKEKYDFFLVDDQSMNIEKSLGNSAKIVDTVLFQKTFNPTYDLIRLRMKELKKNQK